MAATEDGAVSGDMQVFSHQWWREVSLALRQVGECARAACDGLVEIANGRGQMPQKMMADSAHMECQLTLSALGPVEAVTLESHPKATKILNSVNGATLMTPEEARQNLNKLTSLISLVSDPSFGSSNISEAVSQVDDLRNFRLRKLADLQRFLTTVCTADACADPAQPIKRPRTDDDANANADACSHVKRARDSVNAQLNKAVAETANCVELQLQAVLCALPMSNPEAVEACVQAIKGALKANDSDGEFVPTTTRVELMATMALAFDKVCDGVNTGASGSPGV